MSGTCRIISTRKGRVQGTISKFDGWPRPVYSFRNVPFAKAPTGPLRFLPPQPAEEWESIRDCTAAGNIPMQSKFLTNIFDLYLPLCREEVKMDEDCLQLSVYTTQLKKDTKKAVMVWFFSGRFEIGSESFYDGRALASLNDVVVVIPNYRLGIFGFLSLGGSSVCPGNAGLLDQVMALKWVRDNIAEFGGDPDNVTIFGESAGGCSVDLHLNSPISQGLFHKAISQSGQATLPLFKMTNRDKSNEALMKHFSITEKEDSRMLSALQDIPAPDLVGAIEELIKKGLSFFPTVGGEFFVKSGKESLKDQDFARVPYLVGCNDSESQGVLTAPLIPGFENGITEEELKRLFPLPSNEKVFESCKRMYLKDENDPKKFSKMLGDMACAMLSEVPMLETVNAHVESGCDVYVYHGEFQFRFSHDKKLGPGLQQKPEWCRCDHMDDIPITFGFPFLEEHTPIRVIYTKEEKEMSRTFMRYITNFAKNGDPNIGEKVDYEWPKYNKNKDYLKLDLKLGTGRNLRAQEFDFWTKEYPQLLSEAE